MTFHCTDEKIELTIEQEAKQMNDEIIDRLVAYRKKMGLTQQDIANATGIQRANIARMESKKGMSAVENLKKYARSLGLELRFETYRPENPERKLPLPVGCSDFKRVSTENYYVDKTMLIKDVLDDNIQVSLFTRPRRFGKSLNMDMLRVFFEKTEEDTSIYFMDKQIWKCGERYSEHQGKYPVICLTFKEAKYETWEEMLQYFKFIMATEYNRHPELFDSDKCNAFEKKFFEKVATGEANMVELTQSIYYLTQMLYKHHGTGIIVIIDEYDIPIQQGYMQGYYEQVTNFIRILFSSAFKDNSYLKYGFLTGILRVAKESIFSGLNNLRVNSILKDMYSQYFGFTSEEVMVMTEYYNVPDKYSEICEWYDGYRFGGSHIFNPWSVVNYFQEKCIAEPYWVSTSSNDIVNRIIENATEQVEETLYQLISGKEVSTLADTSVIYPDIVNESDSVFSFLLVTGYLKLTDIENDGTSGSYYKVGIPNKEVASIYRKDILTKFERKLGCPVGKLIRDALKDQNVEELQRQIRKILEQSVSFHDTANESFYHGLLLGLCVLLEGDYAITSNRESGQGRFDIQLMPRRKFLPGILMEIKSVKGVPEEKLFHIAEEAFLQIETKEYDTEMREKGVSMIIKYGVAFSGKQVQIVMNKQ